MEIWKQVRRKFGKYYRVSNRGRVKSLPRTFIKPSNGQRCVVKGKILKPTPMDRKVKNQYLVVGLAGAGVKKQSIVLVHRLVAEAFIPNPLNLPEVNHKDGVKSNNQSDNLEWVTSLENHQHAHLNGFGVKGSRCGASKLTEKKVFLIKIKLVRGQKQSHLAKEFSVHKCTINDIQKGRSWNHVVV